MDPAPEITDYQNDRIIIFDGHCNLCNASVNFIIDRDPKARFKFTAYQSEFVARNLQFENHKSDPESIMYLYKNKLIKGSDAALEIARNLNGLWPVLYIFKVIPRFLREPIYRFIAKNRYRWFGRRDQCRIPEPDILSRFIPG